MEGIVVDVCAHPKICGLEPFHLFILRRACCVACIARAFFFLLDTTLAPLHSDRGFGFIVQIAAFSSLLMLVAGHLEHGLVRSGTSVEERSLTLEEGMFVC
jgi:hypothetical protein